MTGTRKHREIEALIAAAKDAADEFMRLLDLVGHEDSKLIRARIVALWTAINDAEEA